MFLCAFTTSTKFYCSVFSQSHECAARVHDAREKLYNQASWYEYSRRPPHENGTAGRTRGYSYERDYYLPVLYARKKIFAPLHGRGCLTGSLHVVGKRAAVSNLAVIRSKTALANLMTSLGSPMKSSAAFRLLRFIAGKNCLRSRNKMKMLCRNSLA